MKLGRLLFIICIAGVIISCRKNSPPIFESSNNSTVHNSILINLKNCIYKTFNGETINFCFDSVLSDSRCPKNATCIWQGTAVAQFSITIDNIKYPFILSTLHLPGIYSSATILAGYKIKFVNLFPYPEYFTSPVPLNKIKAEVEITRQ